LAFSNKGTVPVDRVHPLLLDHMGAVFLSF
jgi:hypothetical protein